MAEQKMLAIDLGASSGRGIVGSFDGQKLSIQEIHRFSNDPVITNGRMYWDILRIFHEIKQSIAKTLLDGNAIRSIGIDTWGVDYALLDENGKMLDGVVAKADVYKADTTLASSQMELERAKNNREITKGTLLKERVEESNGVYPLCSDVSDDSKVFAVSYLDTTDISPIGRVVLFYIDAEESENHTDSMFAAVEKTDEIIPVIGYMKKGVLAAVSDVNVYGIGSDGAELWAYPLENTIDQASLGHKEYMVLAFGDSVADKDGREKGRGYDTLPAACKRGNGKRNQIPSRRPLQITRKRIPSRGRKDKNAFLCAWRTW